MAIYDNIITTSKQLPSPNNPPLSLHCRDMMRKIKKQPDRPKNIHVNFSDLPRESFSTQPSGCWGSRAGTRISQSTNSPMSAGGHWLNCQVYMSRVVAFALQRVCGYLPVPCFERTKFLPQRWEQNLKGGFGTWQITAFRAYPQWEF